MNTSNKESLHAWEKNAKFWDDYMGDHSNFFHCDIVRPYTENLLEIKADDFILDIACGNGNFSQRMVEKGGKVVAFDYSKNMIDLAKIRRKNFLDSIDFKVCDATNYMEIISLKKEEKYFNKAVANMAIMDISDIKPLFKGVSDLLCENGIFVFSTHHPCFTFPNDDYLTKCMHKGVAIEGQPVLQNYYHRTMEEILNLGFENNFILDGFYEVPFKGDNKPIIMIIRLRKKAS